MTIDFSSHGVFQSHTGSAAICARRFAHSSKINFKPRRSRLLLGLSLVLLLVANSSELFGALLIVRNPADSGPETLRDRIASANTGDEIHFDVPRPIVLNSPLMISKNLTIIGPSGSGLKISGNNTTRVFNITGGLVTLEDLTICDGRITGTNGLAGANGENVFGAGIFIGPGTTVFVVQCILSNNVAVGGQGGPPTEFGPAGNGGNGLGGAIGNFGSMLLVGSFMRNNTAYGGPGGGAGTASPGVGGQGWGGALYSQDVATIRQSTFYANQAIAGTGDGGPGTGSGGAIYNISGMSVGACTIVSNSATGSNFDYGGGINESGIGAVFDSTIVGNEADYAGGVTGGEIGNTIIAGNIATSSPDGSGIIHSDDYNLIQNTNGMTLNGTNSHNIIGQDPLLGPLKFDGPANFGFIPPSMAPLPGSPLIDRGRNILSYDQRTFARPYDGSLANAAGGNGADIGAVEIQPGNFLVINKNSSGPGSLRQAILDNNGLGGGGTIGFSNTVTGTITLTSGELWINAPVTIDGPGAGVLAVSGNNNGRVLTVVRGPAEIKGLTLCNGLVVGGEGSNGNDGWDERGGGIYNEDTLLLVGCTIRSNRVVGGLGGQRHLGTVGRGGKAQGGGIHNAGGNLTLQLCSLEGNSAVGGQGGSSLSGEAGSAGNGLGGAICSLGGTLHLGTCSLSDNTAVGGPGGVGGTPGVGGQGYGAGVYNEGSASALFSTINSGNAMGGAGGGGNGSGYGGGIYNVISFGLAQCTVASNSASGSSFDFGGGIYNDGTLGVTNVTIAGNNAEHGGGLHGNAFAANSIFAANIGSSSGPDVKGTITSFDYNLIQNLNGLNILGVTAHVIIGADPLLSPLANNGGLTRTMALRPGSPAIDQGKNFSLPNDQRGAARPFDFATVANAGDGDGSDIGAFEFGLPRLSITGRGPNVVVSWPCAYADFTLEAASALEGTPGWSAVMEPAVIGYAEQFYVTNNATTGNQWFRLKSR